MDWDEECGHLQRWDLPRREELEDDPLAAFKAIFGWTLVSVGASLMIFGAAAFVRMLL